MTRQALLFVLLPIIFFIPSCMAPKTKGIEVDEKLAAIESRKQKQLALVLFLSDWTRLNRLSYKVMSHSVDLCKDDITKGMGAFFINKYSLADEFREVVSTDMKSERIQVFQIVKASPAEKAGLEKGDLILKIDGKSVPEGESAISEFSEIFNEASENKFAITLDVMRGTQEKTFSVNLEPTCNYQVLMNQDDIINAFADGDNVIITKGMMRFAKDDSELALVISHEIAHNAMGHFTSNMINAIPGFILDMAVALLGVNTQGTFAKATAGTFSQELEFEADYVGLYMMAKSGLPIEDAPNFWRKMATVHPASINANHAASHPATSQRFLALEKTVQEIKNKISNGQPLTLEVNEGEEPLEKTGVEEDESSQFMNLLN
ncbi:MAG: M48 family metalloprotease [Nitrospinae bacterium]|nr:M48 family metalloprotease [Nitrospinota bacterium]